MQVFRISQEVWAGFSCLTQGSYPDERMNDWGRVLEKGWEKLVEPPPLLVLLPLRFLFGRLFFWVEGGCQGGTFLVRMGFSLIWRGKKNASDLPDLKERIVSYVMVWIPLLKLFYVHKINFILKLKQLLECFIQARGKSDHPVSDAEWEHSRYAQKVIWVLW